MRVLRSFFDPEQNSWKSRVIWQNLADETPEQRRARIQNTVEDEEGFDFDMLDNPLKVSLKHLHQIKEEAQEEPLEPEHKSKIRDLIGYYISTGKANYESFPPKLLFEMYYDPFYRNLMSAAMLREVKGMFDKRREELQDIVLKDANKWTHWDIAKVSSIYTYLKRKSFDLGQDGTEDPLFTETRKKLIQRGVMMLTRYRVENMEEDIEEGDIAELKLLSSRDGAKGPLQTAEKVLLLEIHRLFPDQNHWGVETHAPIWKELMKESLSQIHQNKENPNFIAALEILDDFLEEPEEDETDEEDPSRRWRTFEYFDQILEEIEEETGEDIRDNLHAFVKRAKAAQFLLFAESSPALLPSHLSALEEIVQDAEEGNLGAERIIASDWKSGKDKFLSAETQAKLDDVSAKRKAKEVERTRLQNAFFDDYLANLDDEDPLKVEYQEKKEALDGIRDEDIEEREQARNYAQGLYTSAKSALEASTAAEDSEEKKRLRKEYEERDKEYRRRESDYNDIKNKREKAIGDLKAFQKQIKDKAPVEKKLSEKELEKGGNKDELTRLDDEIELLRKEEWQLLYADKGYQSLQPIFEAPGEKAKEVKAAYIEGLQQRVLSHQLRSADLAVLWDDDYEEEIWDEDEGLLKFSSQAEQEDLEEVVENRRETLDEFRERFEQVLNDKLDEVELRADQLIVGNADDKYNAWFDIVEESFSHQALERALAEEGFVMREQFPSPQVISQMLEGAMVSYRDQIEENLFAGDVPDEDRDEFLAQWRRLHHKVQRPQDVERLNAEADKFFEQRQVVAEQIEQEKKYSDDFIEGLENDEDREKLEEAFQLRKDWYTKGHYVTEQDEHGRESTIFVPGVEALNEIAQQTALLRQEVSDAITPLKDDLQDVQQAFIQIAKGNREEADLRRAQQGEKLEDVFRDWRSVRREFSGFVDEAKAACEGIVPQEFIAEAFTGAEKMLTKIDTFFDEFRELYEHEGGELTGSEPYFEAIPAAFNTFDGLFNFRDGLWEHETQRLSHEFEKGHKALGVMKEKNFFDGTTEKEDFRNRFKKAQSDFNYQFTNYSKNISHFQRAVEGDMGKLDDVQFFERYKFEKEFVQGMLNDHLDARTEYESFWKRFNTPNFIDEWVERYDTSPQHRVEALNELGDWELVGKDMNRLHLMSKDVEEWLDGHKRSKMETSTRRWDLLSFYDIYRLFKESLEAQEKQWKRNSDRAVGNIGVRIFGQKNRFGREFKRRSEESESERIKEYQTQYNDQQGWEISEALYDSSDPDEVRACINMLKEKGFLKWEDPRLWETLMRLQNAVYFRIPEDMYLQKDDIRDKVRRACEIIWNGEVFRQWDTSLVADLQKAQDSFKDEFDEYEAHSESRTHILASMLKKWRDGKMEGVDPARYEGFLRRAFENGKMNSFPDQRFYFLIQAATLKNPHGQTILTQSAFTRFGTEFLARFPHVEFFTDKGSPKKDGRIVPVGTPGAEARAWKYEDYLKWSEFLGSGDGSYDPSKPPASRQTTRFFFEFIHQSEYARDRVQRMQRMADKEGDHDDAPFFFAEWSKNQLVQALVRRSEGTQKNSPDFWRRFMSGFMEYMKYMNEYIDHCDQEWGQQKSWQDRRSEILQEVGSRLHIAMVGMQTMQGNYGALRERQTVFDLTEWKKKGTDYSPSLEDSKELVDYMMLDILDQEGDAEEYRKAIGFYGVRYGMDDDARAAAGGEELKEVQSKIKNLLTEETGWQYFGNEKAVKRAMENLSRHGKMKDI